LVEGVRKKSMRKMTWLALLAIALATVAATEARAATDPALNGAWVMSNGSINSFDDGNWIGLVAEGEPFLMGTYATEGGVVYITLTHIHGIIWGEMLGADFGREWLPINEARTAFIEILGAYGLPPEDAAAEFDSRFGPVAGSAYSVSGDMLTLSGETFTRM